MKGVWSAGSLEDMIAGYARAIRSYYSTRDMGPWGDAKQQQKWHEEMQDRRSLLDAAMVPFATMIASMSWYKGGEIGVEGIADVFHLMKAGHMSPSVVRTCIKWLGADLDDVDSREQTVDRLLGMLNHHWSGWERVEPVEGSIPALAESRKLLPLNSELKKVVPIPYQIASSKTEGLGLTY